MALHEKFNALKYRLKNRLALFQVIGYRKSGNTWLRVLITKSLIEKFSLSEQNRLYGDYTVHLDRRIPNIIWSHGFRMRMGPEDQEQIDPSISWDRRTILLVRDPRDVLVSHFFHEVYRKGRNQYSEKEWAMMFPRIGGQAGSKEPELSKYIRSPLRGIEPLVRFMNYWIARGKEFPEFMMIRYEDLHERPMPELQRTMAFLNTEITTPQAERVVQRASFENMRAMELEQDVPEADLGKPKDVSDLRTFKTRSGKTGGYKEELSQEDLAFVNHIIQADLDPVFKYN